ncbi:sensor histidine kinase [Novosphingobium olei]
MASVPLQDFDDNDPVSARPHVPARQVVMSAIALWLCYFLLITVRGLVVELGEFTELLWRRGLVTLAGIGVTLLVWPLLRRFDGRSIGLRVAASLVLMLPAALALAIVNQQAFAPVEQRITERMAAQQGPGAPDAAASQAPDAPEAAPSAPDPAPEAQASAGLRIRHDLSGNVLIDVPDPVPVSPRVAPPAPPEPPAPPAPPANVQNFPLTVRDRSDGSSEMIAPGGVIIRHNADGTAVVRAGGMVVQVDGEDAAEIAREIEEARKEAAEAQRAASNDARREAIEAQHQALEGARRNLAEAGIALAPLEPPRAASSSSAPSAPEGKKAKAVRPAASRKSVTPAKLAETPKADRSDASSKDRRTSGSDAALPASATPSSPATAGPNPSAHVQIIRKAVEDEGLWRQLTDVALGRYFLLIAWAALYLALGNGEMARAAERREGEYRRAAKAAELRSLRYQVNPHFLFNTLNSLSALVMVGRTEQAEKMIQTISSFYRHSLASDPTSDVPLSDEIALQRHYLEIEAVRFPDRLRTEFDVPDALLNACVPGMILQPLVENSIKYAVSASTRPVTVRIAAREAEGLLVLTVADDGPGKVSKSGSTGIGLDNVCQRLAARFGRRASVESGALPAGGYATVLTLPVIRTDC